MRTHPRTGRQPCFDERVVQTPATFGASEPTWLRVPPLARHPALGRPITKSSIASAVAAILCMPANAADEPPSLEEVIVTATRRAESIENTPYNISAMTSDEIEQLRLNKIDDVAHWVPGISVMDQGTSGSNAVIMRGLNVANLGASPAGVDGLAGAVAEYLGEVPLFFDFRLLDIDRVEVLEGPQGTLYGSGSLSGTIRFIPKKADLANFALETHVRAFSLKGAPNEGADVDATINVPLINGKLAMRAVVGYYHDPGFINDTRLVNVPGVSLPQPDLSNPAAVAANLHTERGVNFDHTITGRVTFRYVPNEIFEAELGYAYERTFTHGLQATHDGLLGTGPYDYAGRVVERSDRRIELGSLVLTTHLGFADLVSSSSYALRRVFEIHDNTEFGLQSGYGSFPSFVEFGTDQVDRRQYVEELRLVSTGEDPWRWVAGLFYQNQKNETVSYDYEPGLPEFLGITRPDALDDFNVIENPFTDKAVFGELTYQFTPAWQVTVGERWFRDTQLQTYKEAFPIYDVLSNGGPSTGFDFDSNFRVSGAKSSSIYKFNTSYRFTPELMLYATVSQGYRAGGINVVPECAPNQPKGVPCLLPDEVVLKPDTTTNYELGMRSTWLDHRLLLNGALYDIKWKDLRVHGISRLGADFLTNGSSARSRGVELQFQALLPYQLSLLGSYTFTDARMTAPATLGGINAQQGDRLPESPRHMGSLGLRYVYKLPKDYSFDASYSITARSNVFTTIGLRQDGEILPGYTTHDVSVGLSKNNWNVSLFAENLTNKYAFTGTQDDLRFGGAVDGIFLRGYFHSVLRPREIGLEARVNF